MLRCLVTACRVMDIWEQSWVRVWPLFLWSRSRSFRRLTSARALKTLSIDGRDTGDNRQPDGCMSRGRMMFQIQSAGETGKAHQLGFTVAMRWRTVCSSGPWSWGRASSYQWAARWWERGGGFWGLSGRVHQASASFIMSDGVVGLARSDL